jgi:arylformamidase
MTIISVSVNDQIFSFDAESPINIAVPLKFDGDQPNAYDVEKATATAYETGDLVGDTRRGGSCNFDGIKFIPHCNGTHTECVGHITDERISVHDCLKDVFTTAALISVTPENSKETDESYAVPFAENDCIITRKSIENALANLESKFHPSSFILHSSLILRTLPNDESKLSKTYLNEIPPFFSTEAIKFIKELNIRHLLVDMPSIDRLFDEGKLSNHRLFWNVEQGSKKINEKTLINRTITELIYVSDKIEDGAYLLNLQIAPFMSDAAPSRPILFKIQS